MPFIITDPCIGTKDSACVDVCPVDCIHPRKDEPEFERTSMLYIHPDECIDCGACVPACPVAAIYDSVDSTPPSQKELIEANAVYRAGDDGAVSQAEADRQDTHVGPCRPDGGGAGGTRRGARQVAGCSLVAERGRLALCGPAFDAGSTRQDPAYGRTARTSRQDPASGSRYEQWRAGGKANRSNRSRKRLPRSRHRRLRSVRKRRGVARIEQSCCLHEREHWLIFSRRALRHIGPCSNRP